MDDIGHEIAPPFKRPRPAPTSCSDSELLPVALVGECRGWDVETEMVSYWREHRDLFPTQSRFNHRHPLMHAFNLIRQAVLTVLDWALDHQCVIDRLPVPVVKFPLVSAATRDWAAPRATVGYKLHLRVTLNGLMLDFGLTPAHARDVAVGQELLAAHTDLKVLGDKAFFSTPVATELAQRQRIILRPLPPVHQHQQLPPAQRRLHNQVR
ncbi:MAG: transposase [Chloroflexi bacterium]|nr:hypothetical protein [Chloroflexota bacterium]NOG66507.1 transposase [Chloroflexota bacterium]